MIGVPEVVPPGGVIITWERSDGEIILTAPFPVGITTITWIATNPAGSDTCQQLIEIVDTEPPAFDTPAPPDFCVYDIYTATFDGQPEPLTDIVPVRPDWYIVNGTTELDLANITDNCCAAGEMVILWTIDFSDGHPSVNGTGQPSLYGPITLWGTTDFTVIVHTITYVMVDCHGNSSEPETVNITINPRPNVIKLY
jgi:hypothetical protein